MVTIENEIFTETATRLRAKFSGIYVSGEYVNAPPSFPAVSIEESDNYTASEHLDNDGEDYAVITYTVNVYTNKTVGKKSQAKEILAEINDVLISRNFERITSTPVPNADSSIYRMTAQYRAETDGTNMYRYL